MFYVNNSSISAVTGKFTFSASELAAAQTLVDTYRVILGTRLNLEEVIREGNFNYTYEQLNKMIDSQAVNGTEIFSVTSDKPRPAGGVRYCKYHRVGSATEGRRRNGRRKSQGR